jgi:hypothetical protein
MTDGGLLKKALEQKTGTVIEAEIQSEPATPSSEGFSSLLNSNGLKAGLILAIMGLVSGFITSAPKFQQEHPGALLFPILLVSGSFFFLWTTFDRKKTGAIAVFCILMLAAPYVITSLDSSSLTIVGDELTDDSTQVVLKIRESGSLFGSADSSANIEIKYDGTTVWNQNVDFSVNREDGIGSYGLIYLNLVDFYSGNADFNNQYVVYFSSGDSDLTYVLTDSLLQRTITDVEGDTVGVYGGGVDCSEDKETCVIGIGLRTWSGLATATSSNKPGGLLHANYDVKATLYYESITPSNIAIDYPLVSVNDGEASWDSMSGEYGAGSYSNVGDFGSELPLDGSVEDQDIGMQFIPIENMDQNDFGCYVFEIVTNQDLVWSSASITSLSYYLYEETGEDQTGGGMGGGSNDGDPTDELWTPVSSC